ncbi:hypothetical protein KPL74_08545 [Bacillus sp. NP157]|nr:hypothetical protein KPL74_08545 [Bacillus sp. NP157]
MTFDSEPDLQPLRRANLRYLMAELGHDGIVAWATLGRILGIVSGSQLVGLLANGLINDRQAREIEWAMQRPSGWLDRIPSCALDN